MSDVPEGYKMSDVGVIPEDWDVKTFGEVMTGFSSGATPYRGRPEYYKGNIKWITSGELNYNVITDTIEKITDHAVRNTNLKIHPKGTFLMAITGLEAEGTRGSCGIVGAEATTNQSCMALFPTKELLTEYLFHYYVNYGNSLALEYCQGTKQQSYTAKIVKILPIIVPPTIEEQQAIASALSDVDALITALEQLITKKRNIKQGAMQQLLTGEKRLPGFCGEWSEVKLGNECELITKGTTPTSLGREFKNNGINFIKIESLEENGKIIKEKIAFIDEETHRLLNRSQLKENDTLISIAGALGRIAIVKTDILPANTNQALALVRLKQQTNLNVKFLFYFLNSTQIKNHINNINVQAAQANLSLENINDFKIICPTFHEQTAIALILSDIDTEIEALEQKQAKYKVIKQGMMQELLTGKTRLV